MKFGLPSEERAALRRRGFTLIELLVVIAIIAILVALLLPAVQQVREAARKSQCQDHFHNIGVAIHNYEGTYKRFPSSGESTDTRTMGRKFFPVSMFVAILPQMEQKPLYDQMNLNFHYTNSANSTNAAACKNDVDVFLCPSSVQEKDSLGYGVTDYMPVAYTDLHPTSGLRDKSTGMSLGSDRAGALGFCRPMAHCTDGVSNTILVIEDASKPTQVAGSYDYATASAAWLAPNTGMGLDTTQMFAAKNAVPGTFGGSISAPNRWADPDCGSGVSGAPSTHGMAPPAGFDTKIINQNNSPKGGPTTCLWSQNNCGPNDEPFSMHPGGCQAVLGDGKVPFLSENVDRQVVRRLCDPADGEPVRVP